MGRISDLSNEFGKELGECIDDITLHTPLTKAQVTAIFTPDEMKELRNALGVLDAARDANDRAAKMLALGSKAIGLLKKAGVPGTPA